MYSWVTHMHSHLGGQCPHKCSYCYVQKNRFGVPARYQGELRLIESEFKVNYGSGKKIFIEHMNDLFAEDMADGVIDLILEHCRTYPNNTYVFQSKNPRRVGDWINDMPPSWMMGTTIETNRSTAAISNAPEPIKRTFRAYGIESFITIEPILKFDLKPFMEILKRINPTFINIGADSKGCGLPEPTPAELQDLIKAIQDAGLTIKIKSNLSRLLKE